MNTIPNAPHTADTSAEDHALEYLALACRALIETEGAGSQRAQMVEAAMAALIDESDIEKPADAAMLDEALVLLADIKAGLASTAAAAADRFLALVIDLAVLDLKAELTAEEKAT